VDGLMSCKKILNNTEYGEGKTIFPIVEIHFNTTKIHTEIFFVVKNLWSIFLNLFYNGWKSCNTNSRFIIDHRPSTIAPLGAMAHCAKGTMRWRLKEPPRGHYVAASIAQSAIELRTLCAVDRPAP